MSTEPNLNAALVLCVLFAACQPGTTETTEEADAGAGAEALIADALSAALPSLAATATVVDWDGNVLREGSGDYTCLPTPAQFAEGRAPMCMDEPWMAWADAWNDRTELSIDRIGFSYMLAGDEGASNIDPFAARPTEDNQWVVEGPHLMIIAPDPSTLEGISTDPENGGPYVMWKGTPYAHVMVPVDIPEDVAEPASPVEDALSAINAALASTATVADWDGNVLQEGSGAYTCLPTPPQFAEGRAPMCMDEPWMAWADAWNNRTELSIDSVGISYMLAGDEGASNVDPFAAEPTEDNQWVVEGPHLMVIVPNPATLEGLSTDPENGGPYVMWKGTSYAHVMVPVGD